MQRNHPDHQSQRSKSCRKPHKASASSAKPITQTLQFPFAFIPQSLAPTLSGNRKVIESRRGKADAEQRFDDRFYLPGFQDGLGQSKTPNQRTTESLRCALKVQSLRRVKMDVKSNSWG